MLYLIVRVHYMKHAAYIILLTLLWSCNIKNHESISGVWDASNMIRHVSDTIKGSLDFDTMIETTTVKTDTGVVDIMHLIDSIISIEPTSRLDVIQIHFDDKTHGIISFYEIDKKSIPSNEDPRFTATNYNFRVSYLNNKPKLLIDYGFEQNGRLIDTLDYKLLSENLLMLKSDTLKRINKP